MNIEQVRERCLSLLGVTEDMPFGDDVVTFRIEDKIFLCLWLSAESQRFAVKLSPERNEELREEFPQVTPAYHWNKKHWSDVSYGQLNQEQVSELILESYNLVVSKLPKKIREQYI